MPYDSRSHRDERGRWDKRALTAFALSALLVSPFGGVSPDVAAAEKSDSVLGLPGQVYRDEFRSEDLPVDTTFEFNEEDWGLAVDYFDSSFSFLADGVRDPNPVPDPDPDPDPDPVQVEIGTLATGTPDETKYYSIQSPRSGPTVMVLGGIHGNETAGHMAAAQVTHVRPRRGTVVVVPRAYVRAIEIDERRVPGERDLNRRFPRSEGDEPDGRLATDIFDLMRAVQPDWVLDLHEGFDFYVDPSSDSVGQSVIYHPNGQGEEMANLIVNELNRRISDPGHKFTVLEWPVGGSAARAAGDVLGSQAAIMETAWVQPLGVRINQHRTMVKILLRELEMLPAYEPGVETEYVAAGTPYETPFYVITGEQPGPTAMVVAGMRGNHLSGIEAAHRLVGNVDIDTGRLLVLPEANRLAVEAGVHHLPNRGDLNRKFPAQRRENADGILAQSILETIAEYNVSWLMDLQEETDYYHAGTGAIGNTILYHPGEVAGNLAAEVADSMNAEIERADREFELLVNPIWGGLIRGAGILYGVNGLYVGTTDDDPPAQRIEYNLDAVNAMLLALGMKRLDDGVEMLAPGTKYETPLYVLTGEELGPTVMVTAGVRGDQEAAIQAAKRLKDQTIEAGTLLVLPEANRPAIEQGVHHLPSEGDLNRQFPADPAESPVGTLAGAIFSAIGRYDVDWVVDLEEADNYESADAGSEGNSIVWHPGTEAETTAQRIVNELNEEVNPTNQQWVTLENPVWGGLIRAVGEVYGADGFYVSTTTRDSVEQQVSYDLQVIHELLERIGIR